MSKYEVTVPVIHYEKVRLESRNVAELIEQEIKSLIGPKWDGIFIRTDKTGYYYTNGYGSHNIGEEDGPDADAPIIELYVLLRNAAQHFRQK